MMMTNRDKLLVRERNHHHWHETTILNHAKGTFTAWTLREPGSMQVSPQEQENFFLAQLFVARLPTHIPSFALHCMDMVPQQYYTS